MGSEKNKSNSSSESGDSDNLKSKRKKPCRKKSKISSGSTSSSSDSEEKREQKKLKKLIKREKKRAKKLRKEIKKEKKERRKKRKLEKLNCETKNEEEQSADVPLELMDNPKVMAPMTKEEWEKKQSKISRVYDEETGRYRLIKGDGEILEEIVSKEQHKQINKLATAGAYFQKKLNTNI